MKRIIYLIIIVLSACNQSHRNEYMLKADSAGQRAIVSEHKSSISIKLIAGNSERRFLLKRHNGNYFENKVIDVFGEKKTSYNLFLTNKKDTSYVVQYSPSSFPSIPVGSEDRVIILKKFRGDVYYTKVVSLSDQQYFDLFVYTEDYRLLAIFLERLESQYLFYENAHRDILTVVKSIAKDHDQKYSDFKTMGDK